ncbi:MAG: chaperone protein HscA [Moraxellaceae bacterium]|jgi:molecular chaperone HscA|nr:chaperone protein HscA [Moraxellaceae bacterium]
MALLQIAEPGQSTAPHRHRLAVGIDLGTTNSLVATVQSGKARTLPDAAGRHLLPSVVRYFPDGERRVGHEARAAAAEDAHNTIVSVKRLMGRGITDVKSLGGELPYRFAGGEKGMPYLITAAGEKSPVQVSADILSVLRARAEAVLGGELTGAVITVPAYFDDAQRQATKDAAQLAGLKLLRLLNEPTAAAVAYGLDKAAEGVHAIYDLGGGTFDISILRLHKGVFEVLATGGDSALGGDDLDHVIARWVLEQVGSTNPDAGQQRALLQACCAAKEALTTQDVAEICYAGHNIVLDRKRFDALIAPLVERTMRACRRTLRDAGIKTSDVQEVVMVGGSTRVPLVREKVAEYFGRAPLTSIDPDKVVAIGAAIQADVLAGNKPESDMLLLDVIPLSLGLETMGGLVEKIIPRNTTIPAARAQEFTTFKDGQTAMSIHVLQGERDMVADCRSLARFELHGIPPLVAGAARIRVMFQVDADGLLNVSAEETTSGVCSEITVKPSYGLADEEIARMLKESMAAAEADKSARMLAEEKVEGERLLLALEAALQEDGNKLLDVDERAQIEQAMRELREEMGSADLIAIRAGVKALNEASEPFAARRMNAGVRQALTGRSIDEVAKE